MDHRRRNKCEESLELNKQRILSYLDRIVIFPKAGDAVSAKQVTVAEAFPIVNDSTIEPARKISEEEKNTSAFTTLRKAWGIQRYAGIRAKRAAEKVDTAAGKDKK